MTDRSSDWTQYLTEDEARVYEEIQKWEERPGAGFNYFKSLALPVAHEFHRMSPAFIDAIADSLREILKSFRDYSFNTVRSQAIIDKISQKAGRTIDTLADIREIEIGMLDRAADECRFFNRGAATLGGGMTGLIGFNGLLIDLPVLYTLLFRTIQEVSLCYGYAIDSPEERVYILKILELGHLPEDEPRKNTIGELMNLHAAIQGGISLSKCEAQAVLKSIQILSRRIAVQYLGRKLAFYIMLIGGVAGAGMNYLIAGQVADAAFYTYRKRFLMDRAQHRQSAGTPVT